MQIQGFELNGCSYKEIATARVTRSQAVSRRLASTASPEPYLQSLRSGVGSSLQPEPSTE